MTGKPAPKWHKYQEDVAAFFQRAGWTVQVDADIQGVRTRHAIDVWALSNRLGVVIRWVIECKDCKRPVSKDKVLALRSIVDDVGADRGLILNEAGFQKGAHEAAELTNVTVTNLAELETNAEEELTAADLAALHRRLVRLSLRTSHLSVAERHEHGGSLRARRGVSDGSELLRRLGPVSMTEDAAARAVAGVLPVVMPDPQREAFVRVGSRREVLERASEIADWMELWLAVEEANVTKAGGWDDA